jgi:hypothetical protein
VKPFKLLSAIQVQPFVSIRGSSQALFHSGCVHLPRFTHPAGPPAAGYLPEARLWFLSIFFSRLFGQKSQCEAVFLEVSEIPVKRDEFRIVQDRECGEIGIHPDLR